MRKKTRVIMVVIAVIWGAGMAYLLTENSTRSAVHSGWVVQWLTHLPLVGPLIAQDAVTAVRKIAHFGGFMVEGLLVGLADPTRGVLSLPLGAAMAVASELAQTLSPGRSCSPYDMAVDFSGYALGEYLARVICRARAGSRDA